MLQALCIHILRDDFINKIVFATQGTNVSRTENYLRKCIIENHKGKRVTFAAFVEEDFAGLANVIFESSYPYFNVKKVYFSCSKV